MSKVSGKQESMGLYKAILELKDLDECHRFFQDLCTVSELRAMEQRYDVAVLLQQGMIYNHILEKTGASSATISRVNRALNYGAGGYQDVLSRILEQGEKGEQEDT
ncbi:MAG: YerC/YecD family TrpR-related protein [Clostridiales bacterium]|nr:YerC/YecD family TrpR-related protein [Clostridiales bacterium]